MPRSVTPPPVDSIREPETAPLIVTEPLATRPEMLGPLIVTKPVRLTRPPAKTFAFPVPVTFSVEKDPVMLPVAVRELPNANAAVGAPNTTSPLVA